MHLWNELLTQLGELNQKVLVQNLLLAGILFSVAVTLGTTASLDTSSAMLEELGKLLKPLEAAGRLSLIFIIFLNNAVKALGTIIFGIFLGLPPLFFVSANGFILGMVISRVESVAGWEYVVASLAPHGVIEIPILLLTTALGFTIGWQSVNWLMRRNNLVKLRLSNSLKIHLKWVLPGLFTAAIIEVSITPWLLGLISSP